MMTTVSQIREKKKSKNRRLSWLKKKKKKKRKISKRNVRKTRIIKGYWTERSKINLSEKEKQVYPIKEHVLLREALNSKLVLSVIIKLVN